MDFITIIAIVMMFGSMGFVIVRDLYRRFVIPFMCYKLVVFDADDEFTFIKKKKTAIIRKGVKGFILFAEGDKKKKGEFYALPIDKAYGDVNDKFAKRDDRGTITFYFFRNNVDPVQIMPNKKIQINNESRAMAILLDSKVFDASLTMDEPKKAPISVMTIIIVIAVVILVVLFKDKILALF